VTVRTLSVPMILNDLEKARREGSTFFGSSAQRWEVLTYNDRIWHGNTARESIYLSVSHVPIPRRRGPSVKRFDLKRSNLVQSTHAQLRVSYGNQHQSPKGRDQEPQTFGTHTYATTVSRRHTKFGITRGVRVG